jgi:transcriptional regulator with XRE-family HTH domain
MKTQLTRREIAMQTGCTRQFIDFICIGKRRPSPQLAAVLEKVTGIDRLAWLYPDEHENPYVTIPNQEASNGA